MVRYLASEVNPKVGGRMKRLQIIILILVISTSGTIAQNYRSESRGGESYNTTREELRLFERLVDQFSFAMATNNVRAARFAKLEILREMERDITQNRLEIRALNQQRGSGFYSKREPNWRIPRMHSRGNGVQARGANRSILENRVHRLEKQEKLYIRFSELTLHRNRQGIVNENEHRRLMYRFQETIKEKLLAEGMVSERVSRGR